MQLNEDHKLEVLLAAFRDRRDQVDFWRRHAGHVVALFVAMCTALFIAGELGRADDAQGIIGALAVVATIYMLHIAKSADTAVRRLAEIEEALGFFQEGLFVDELALQPLAGKNAFRMDLAVGVYIAAIWIAAVMPLALIA